MAKSITRNDIKEIVTEIVTKAITTHTKLFKIEVFHINNTLAKHNLQFMKLENKIDGIKNDVLQFKDEILGEINDLSDDFAVLTGLKIKLHERSS